MKPVMKGLGDTTRNDEPPITVARPDDRLAALQNFTPTVEPKTALAVTGQQNHGADRAVKKTDKARGGGQDQLHIRCDEELAHRIRRRALDKGASAAAYIWHCIQIADPSVEVPLELRLTRKRKPIEIP